jgi:MEDS: MEthanogen/methylotroph, DcmR Sensory domain
LSCRCHVCAFFHSREDEYKILIPFMKKGLDAGDRTVQIIGAEHRNEQIRRLAESGVDALAAEQRGQLVVRTWEDSVLRGGRFDQHAMIGVFEEIGADGEQRGSGITRVWADIGWALGDFPGVHDIVEYESRLNYVLPKYDIATVCTYDLTQFSASIVMDILRIHPQVIVGKVLRENPFYVLPDEFLAELRGGSATVADVE